MSEQQNEIDAKGCPVLVWDGPYSYRCALGSRVGVCAYHGPFDQPVTPPGTPSPTPTTTEDDR